MTGALRANEAAVTLPVRSRVDRERHNGFLRKGGTLRLLRDCFLLQSLDDDQIQDLAAHSHVRQVGARATLSDPGEPEPGLCIVRRGALKVCSPSRSGRELILDLLEPDDFIGEFSALETPPGAVRVIALRRSELLIIPGSVFQQLVLHDAGVRLACLHSAVRRVRQAEAALQRLAYENVHGRVEGTLRQLAVEEGVSQADGVLLRRRPSQGLLAGLCGTTRETVSRVLRDLETRGVLKCDGRRVLLLAIPGGLG
jgi:CRP/FNR family transcriptional regulator, cyclic AMP receptor protein